MSIQVIHLEHALTPHKRPIYQHNLTTIRELDPKWPRAYIAVLNGKAVMRGDWDNSLNHDDVLAFIDADAIPQGGGGGGASDALKVVLIIAVMVYAPQFATLFGTAATATTAATMGYTAAYTAFVIGGSMLINALIPPPKAPSPQQAASLAAASPTYNLQAQGNQARIDSAIPEHFGRMIAYPDFAAMPYGEYNSNDQYLFQLFCLGRGEYSIESINIEDTPIASFDDITYEVIAPGGSITLFPANVISSVEVSGQSPTAATATYSRSGTTITVTYVAHGLSTGKNVYLDITSGSVTDGTYVLTGAPTADTFTITDTVSGATSGGVTVSPWVGGFIANPAGTTANYIGLDFVMPHGLYYANDNGSFAVVSLTVGVEYRTVDNAGAPISGRSSFNQSYSAATNTAQRYSTRTMASGARWEFRVRRVDVEQTGSRYGHNVVWASMRSYLPETRSFGDVTLIAMRMKASNNLSMQGSRKVNVIATRKLPIWNGSSWSANTATRSIAWPIVYACKQVGLTDAQIDLATLLTLDGTWAGRSDYFDARFDSTLSFWEAVSKMGGAGRAKPYMQGGVVRIMRDQAASLPVALFSVRNIVKGSFTIDYLMPTEDTADAIDVGYFDKLVWAPRRVRSALTGSSALRPAKIELFGVVERDQAFREGMYQAASNRYRRKHIKFSTEMEGFIPSFGDLIAIQHDMPAWGQGGDVIAWNAGTNTATLSENPIFGVGTNYIAFRKLDGSVDGSYVVTPGAQSNEVILASTPTYTPYTGTDKEKTHFAFGSGNAYLQARVLSVTPRSLTRVEISAVNEDSNVHTAETGMITPTRQVSQLVNATSGTALPAVPGSLVITESLYETSGSVGVRSRILVTLSTQPTDVFIAAYNMEFRLQNSVTWIRQNAQLFPAWELNDVAAGLYDFRVQSVNTFGATSAFTAIITQTIYGLTAAPADATNFSIKAISGVAVASWDRTADLDVKIGGDVVIRWTPTTSGATWEGSVILPDGEMNGDAYTAVVPLSTGTYLIKFKDSTGHYSNNAASFVATEAIVTGWTTVTTSTQETAFTGAKTNVVLSGSVIRLDNTAGVVMPTGEYAFSATIDLTTAASRRFIGHIKAVGYDVTSLIDSQLDLIDLWQSIDGGVINDCDATLYSSISNDNVTYSGWVPFLVADFNCRYVKFKTVLVSGNGAHNIDVSELSVVIKIPA